MDVFAVTTAESKALGNAESMKMAARKVSIRVVTVYCFAVFTASFAVPSTHPFLNGEAKSVSESSIFIIVRIAPISSSSIELAKASLRCLKKVWY
jgi:amino acid transporter